MEKDKTNMKEELKATDNKDTKEVKQETLTLTREELNAMLQKEGDKRVTSAQSKWEKDTEKRISEADKLAKMDEESRREYDFAQREKALEARERQLTVESNRATCVSIMSAKGLPLELVDFVVSDDAEAMNESIKLIERVINDAVSKQVLAKIGTDAPTSGSSSGLVSKESFAKMNLKEQMDLFKRDPDLYNTLTK